MLKNVFNTLITRGLVAVSSFILIILTARFLGAEGRGAVSVLGSSIWMLTLLSGFVGGASLVYIIPRHREKRSLKGIILISYLWSIFIGAPAVISLYICGGIPSSLLLHAFFLGVLASFFFINLFLLLSFEKIFFYNLSLLLQIFLNLFFFTFMATFLGRKTIGAYITSLYISYFFVLLFHLPLLLSIASSLPEGSPFSVRLLKDILRLGFISQLGNLIQFLNYRLSYFILNSVRGEAEVGIYSVGVGIAESAWIVATSISTVQYARLANIEDRNLAAELTVKFSNLSVILTLFLLIFFLLLPPGVFTGVFGREFGEVKRVVLFLSPGILILAFAMIYTHYFAATGRYHVNTLSALVGLIFTLFFNLLLVKDYGCRGSAVAADVSYFSICLYVLVHFLREREWRLRSLIVKRGELEQFLRSYVWNSRDIQPK